MKNLIFFEGPVDTFSGYGKHAKDVLLSIMKVFPEKDWEIIVGSTRWGSLPFGALDRNNPEDVSILNKITQNGQLPKQPEIHFQVTIPSEFRPLGKFSVGITAGTESSLASIKFIEGLNKMNMTIVPSKFVKEVLGSTNWIQKDQQTQKTIREIKCEKPIEVLFEGLDLNVFKDTSNDPQTEIGIELSKIPEDFNFLVVGHWLKGDLGQDRKDIGMTIKTFLETFKNLDDAPGLILKVNSASFSILDRNHMQEKIDQIKSQIVAQKLPNVYLVHGEFTDEEMNEIYRHPKNKVMLSFTKGEGFGRPLLEFSATGKPVMVSNHSGHLDFLPASNAVLLPGALTEIHPSAVWEHILVEKSKWWTVDYDFAAVKMNYIYQNYGKYTEMGRKQRNNAIKNFSLDKMTEKLQQIVTNHFPNFPKQMEIKLPKLKKINTNENAVPVPNGIKLPELKKV